MQTNEIQELLLDTIPAWHYWFARPFKRMLNDGVSLDMYYCIQSMRRSGRTMTMTELANFARMPKQQMRMRRSSAHFSTSSKAKSVRPSARRFAPSTTPLRPNASA